MRKIAGLILAIAVAIALTSCASKSEYDKLLDQKASLEKKCDGLSGTIEELKKTISSRDMEIKDLKSELKTANAKANDLEKELAGLKAKQGAPQQ